MPGLVFLGMASTFAGCVTGERTVSLTPNQPAPETSNVREEIGILSTRDNRRFQNKPSDPSIPSIQGDVETLIPDQQIRMIGRQRNTFGQALGDVQLPEGDSILARTRKVLERGFAARGYRVVSGAGENLSGEVSVDEFWAWVSPGFWSIKVEAKIKTTLTLHLGAETKSIVVQGYGIKGSSSAITNKTWEIVYDLAIDDYLENFDRELTSVGL